MERTIREYYCPRCNFIETLQLGEKAPEICPACGDGKPPIIDVKLGTTAETRPDYIKY